VYLVDQRKTVTKTIIKVFKVKKQLEKDLFGKKLYFYIVKKDTVAIEVDNIPKSEDKYRFNLYSVRDDTVKVLVEHSLDSESLLLNREAIEDENIEDNNKKVSVTNAKETLRTRTVCVYHARL
jgi:hypothetical protein